MTEMNLDAVLRGLEDDLAAKKLLLADLEREVDELEAVVEPMRRWVGAVDDKPNDPTVERWTVRAHLPNGEPMDFGVKRQGRRRSPEEPVPEEKEEADAEDEPTDPWERSVLANQADGEDEFEMETLGTQEQVELTGPALGQAVLKYIRANPGLKLSVRRVADALSERGFKDVVLEDVRNAMHLARQLDPHLRQESRKAWVYTRPLERDLAAEPTEGPGESGD